MVGKKIKMEGQMSVMKPGSGRQTLFYRNHSGCNGMLPAGNRVYPENGSEDPADYPEAGTEVCVAGEFQLYDEDGETYCHLVSSDILE